MLGDAGEGVSVDNASPARAAAGERSSAVLRDGRAGALDPCSYSSTPTVLWLPAPCRFAARHTDARARSRALRTRPRRASPTPPRERRAESRAPVMRISPDAWPGREPRPRATPG